MATPAAILGILVKASTTEANLALAKTDAQLSATAASAERTTAATSTAGANMKKMGTAAKLAGAAIAVGFIIEAKKAVAVTQDLTKSTISLHENLGIANKQASKWAAVAKARGVDTTKLGMAFKTFATQVDSATKGSASSIKMFDELGISQKELASNQNNVQKLILQTADGIDQLGAGTKRTTAESKLFGRGWQTVAPLIRDGSGALKENLDLTEKYGATLQGQTLKAQEELLANTRESKLAWMGLQISLAKFVTPALNTLEDQFQRIATILGSDKLTQDEKFSKVAGIIQKDFQKALDVALGLIPEFANSVGQAAPQIASAFVEGFLNADAWGKLVLGSFLISKLGGLGAFRSVGTKMGGTLATGFTLAAALGIEEGFTQPGGIIDTIEGNATDLTVFADVVDPLIAHLKKTYGSLRRAGLLLTEEQKAQTEAQIRLLVSTGNMTETQGDRIIATLEGEGKAFRAEEKIAKDAQDGLVKALGRSERSVGDLGQAVAKGSEKMREDLGKATDAMAKTTKDDFMAMAIAAGVGLGKLSKLTNSALDALGVDKVSFGISGVGAAAGTGAAGKQRGGMIGGSGSGDKVHVMAEPGEGFINKTAVRALGGGGAIDAINRAIPRFASGGMVGGDTAGLVAPFMQALSSMSSSTNTPINVTSGFRTFAQQQALWNAYQSGTGNLAARPGTSHHEQGIAADIVPGRERFGGVAGKFGLGFTVPSESWHIELLNAAAAGAMGPAAQKIARVLLKGPAGALRSTGQGALDKVRSAANTYIGKQAPAVGGGLGPSVAMGSIQNMAKAMVTQIWGAGQWSPFNLLEMQEAGWNPRALNPSSGAAGLAQALPASKYPPGAWPYQGPESARLQLQWMMGYIHDRYGTPAGAWAHEQSVGWYGKGGTVPGPIGRPQRAIVHGGETITPAGAGPHVEVNVYGGMVEDVEVLIDGKMPEIADYVIREGGRNRARSRQLAGSAGRG